MLARDVFRYRKEFSLSECRKRPITIFGGRFYRRRCCTYSTIPQGPAQHVTSINIRGEINPHQVNSINTNILRGIHDDVQEICKPNMSTFFLVLPIVQASLCYYQGAKRIISKFRGGTSVQHQDQHPVDSTPTSALVCTRENCGYTRMP